MLKEKNPGHGFILCLNQIPFTFKIILVQKTVTAPLFYAKHKLSEVMNTTKPTPERLVMINTQVKKTVTEEDRDLGFYEEEGNVGR